MSSLIPTTLIVLLALSAFYAGRRRALLSAGGRVPDLHSLPAYHGIYVALWSAAPAALIWAVWTGLEPALLREVVTESLPDALRNLPADRLSLVMNDIENIAAGAQPAGGADPVLRAAAGQLNSARELSGLVLAATVAVLALGGGLHGYRRIRPGLRARNAVEKVLDLVLVAAAAIAILTTIGIVLSLLFEAVRFFRLIPIDDFLFGLSWSPQTALRADQVGSSGSFGALPLFAGTILVTLIAMVVAVPIGLMSAVYMAEYAPRRVRDAVKPSLEILAGVPTVVYGFFAATTMAPAIRGMGESLGLGVASESALAAGLVMGIMIIPFVSSLSDDVINAVPQSLREGSYALGATRSETIIRVVLPAALPGIVGGVLLAVSRAIGETMIVVMAAGLAANLTANPLEAVTTVTVQIVTLLVGDQEFDSAKTLAAFALGLVLFCVTLVLNVVALEVVRKYREKYD